MGLNRSQRGAWDERKFQKAMYMAAIQSIITEPIVLIEEALKFFIYQLSQMALHITTHATAHKPNKSTRLIG